MRKQKQIMQLTVENLLKFLQLESIEEIDGVTTEPLCGHRIASFSFNLFIQGIEISRSASAKDKKDFSIVFIGVNSQSIKYHINDIKNITMFLNPCEEGILKDI